MEPLANDKLSSDQNPFLFFLYLGGYAAPLNGEF